MPSTSGSSRQEKIQTMQRSQDRAEKLRGRLIIGLAILLALALIGTVVGVIVSTQGERDTLENLAAEDIDGVEDYGTQTQNHVTTPVTYEVTPPVGGDHTAFWQNCGFYEKPIASEPGVHALEHGAVWVTYDSSVSTEDIQTLEDLAGENRYLLVSPWTGELPQPIMVSAWGLQLGLESANDQRLDVFLLKYLQGEQTPEPGASCSNGSSDTL